ncbi:lipopolysaccharide heptosyltransferase II [Vibrio crassostreae]|uniref:lipopolysaccharide heptosyltransferase II n=1 Tax=Vibrio crassostreae TaxID=246167 RepID=UPI001047B56E|nr:lipopolysaccharide heptosyltransferase II [Vibrio crassostreae]TCN84386.1 heptosyltransferase-2 [Vibrio crassostreae]TCN92823.1 heptosyltransferase-2 [Vibrio crassostreae]CAK1933952.1 ADP-heptose--LPS heptosyltransferase 2 [Vibrio crassostreae]CAK1942049.1 ADP-heptose--LPS heptosyltransferase 2 [Vibrio crassostreae]CAK1947443.1 ADP-heptose--LPS heptosyltransferase 2 [Vibrio crassostreae]
MKKILVIGPSWVGDMVMSQSLYITLKQQNPNCVIDVMAPGWCKPILERMPEINQTIDMPLTHGDFNFFKRRALGIQLREKGYTHAYICPNSAKSALIPWFANIPNRIGWKGEFRYGLLNDLRSNKQSFQYMVERYIALAHPKESMADSSSLGGIDLLPRPSLEIKKDVQQATIKRFNLTTDKSVIGLCPGAEFGPAKQWPVEHYATVANKMIEQGYQVWLFGSNKDQGTTDTIKSLTSNKHQASIINLAGKTNLIEAIDLLAACETVVSNDSGLMHIAAAVGCHVVGVYGSTSPKYTPPLAKKVDIVSTNIECRPCFKRECPLGHLKCLKELQPHSVISKIT